MATEHDKPGHNGNNNWTHFGREPLEATPSHSPAIFYDSYGKHEELLGVGATHLHPEVQREVERGE